MSISKKLEVSIREFLAIEDDPLIAGIDAILPQTQCRQCGYDGCKPYAAAIAAGDADINQCPPGGDDGIHALAGVLGLEYKPLNPQHGEYKPKAIALIDESNCIGCTLCIQACPVDAILGASKQMHTVIASECTGCELCLAPCPVDCISMEPLPVLMTEASQLKQAANLARERHMFRLFRIAREKSEQNEQRKQKVKNASVAEVNASNISTADALKKAAIAAAIARVRAQKSA